MVSAVYKIGEIARRCRDRDDGLAHGTILLVPPTTFPSSANSGATKPWMSRTSLNLVRDGILRNG